MPMASKSPFHDNGSSEVAVESMYLSGNNGTCMVGTSELQCRRYHWCAVDFVAARQQ